MAKSVNAAKIAENAKLVEEEELPFFVDTSSIKVMLLAIVRHLITLAGAALATRGLVDQSSADALVNPLADVVLGLVMSGGSILVTAFLSKRKNDKLLKVEEKVPGDKVITTKPI